MRDLPVAPLGPPEGCAQVPGALDEVPGAPFGSGEPARTFLGTLLAPRGGVAKSAVAPGGSVFGPWPSEQ